MMGDVNVRRSGPQWGPIVVLAVSTLVIVSAVVVAVRLLNGSADERSTGTGVLSPAPGLASAVSSPVPASSAPAVPALTPRQLAGQRVIYSYPGLTPPASLLEHIRKGEAAGVIFFSDNVSS